VAAVLGGRVLRVSLGPLEILSQDKVDDAGDRIAAVDRGGAVFQNLDALDRGQGNGVEVAAKGREGVVGDAATVEQNERRLIAQPAQRCTGESGFPAVVLGQPLRLAERAVAHRRRNGVDELGSRLDVRSLISRSDDLYRQRLRGRWSMLLPVTITLLRPPTVRSCRRTLRLAGNETGDNQH
jgi:hypothetical protein